MNTASWTGAASIVNLLPLAAITASGNGAAVDIQPYRGHAIALLDSAAPSAGTTPALTVKLQTSPEADKVTRASVSYTGTGNGRLEVEAGTDPVAEDITFTATSATEFSVVGSVSGAIGTLTVGTRFASAQVNALITAGATAFVATDAFTVPTTARTWTDLVSFTGQTTALLREKKALNVDQLPRYLRAVKTIGGTNSPAYLASLNLLVVSD